MKNLFFTIFMVSIAHLANPIVALASEKITESVPEVQILKDENAALRYLMAIGFMPEISGDDSKKLTDIDSLESYEKISGGLKSKLSEASSYRTMNLLDFAAKCKDCNFMPDQSWNPQDYVPPYRTLRNFARYLNAGGWARVKSGDHETAARLFVATFRFGDDAENYGPLISYMIGHAIREIALKSMKTFLAADCKPEAKKIILDYLRSLPKPAFRAKEGMVWERTFTEKMLKTLDSNEGMIEILKNTKEFSEESEKQISSNREKACCANQRVLMGALEMAGMDGIKFPENAGFDEILEKLVKDKYLFKAVECPRKGEYKVKFDEKDNYAEISCTCGADPEKTASQEEKEQKPEKEVKKSKLAEKAEEYRNSGKFDRDRKELLEYYDRMINFDQFKPKALEEIKKIQEEYENKGNLLIKMIGVDFRKLYEKQLKMQDDIESFIR